MLKIIPPGSYDFGMPTVSLMDIWSRGPDKDYMRKRAAVMDKHIAGIRPEKGHSFLHLISMGSHEYFGGNCNADTFNEKAAGLKIPHPKPGTPDIVKLAEGLVKYHSTFMKNAHVFKHHKNTDPKYSIGDLASELYNPEMHRGELIIKVANDHPDWEDDLEGLAKGKEIPFSMSCKIAKDLCGYCGNRARSRMEYCDHLRNHMGEITKEGHQMLAWNDDPFFFDISKVIKNADRIALSLRKVAETMWSKGGAALAEEEGLTFPAWLLDESNVPMSKFAQRKLAVARKLAEIEKVIEGVARGAEGCPLKKALGCPPDLPPHEMEKLQKAKLYDALEGLGSAQICLSLRDFFRLVMGPDAEKYRADMGEAEGMLPDMFSRLNSQGDLSECANDSSYDTDGGAVPGFVKQIVEGLTGDHSIAPGPAKRRVTIAIIRGNSLPEKRAGYVGQSKRADYLVKEYAKYLLSFGLHADRNDEGRELTVLRNRFTV